MMTIAFLLSALICLALAWILGKSCRPNDGFISSHARLCARRYREGRLCPEVEFELDGQCVRCTCLPVSGKSFPFKEGDLLTIRYRRQKILGMHRLTVVADDSSLRERRMLMRIACLAFCGVGIALLAIAVIFHF